MDAVTAVMLVFSILGALDRIIGNRFRLGEEFEKGFMLLGPLALTVIGMVVMSPLIARLLNPVLSLLNTSLGMEPSIITSALFANDLGGGILAREVCADPLLGRFNGMVVAAMIGCTISFTIPYALNSVPAEKHEWLLLGLLCGIIAIPVGCFVGGLIQSVPIVILLGNMLPLIILSLLLAAGLLFFPKACTVIFGYLGKLIQIIITIGLMLSIIRLLSGKELLTGLGTFGEGAEICLNAAVIMTGAFPLLSILSRLLKKPISLLHDKLAINEHSTIGFISTLANSMPTFDMMSSMDNKGVMLNSAFAVSAAFVFGDHLAFTLAFDAPMMAGMIVGKLVAGVIGVFIAAFMYRRKVGHSK